MQWGMVLAAVIFIGIASFVRGLTGFGFAIVATPLLALVFPPAVAVPVATLLQIPSGLPTVFRDWPDTDFRSASIAWLGGVPALVPGVYLVANMSPDIMRLAVGVAVVFSSLCLAFGVKANRNPKGYELFGAGALSGLMQGAVAMAGPPVILLILSSSWSAARCRATLSCVFLFLGTASVVIGFLHGIVTRECVVIATLSIPALLLGQYLGAYVFDRIDASKYRKISILCVAATGVVVTIKGLSFYL
ncbi:putative transmembrane protein [Afipia carboxidovorans OM5]|uniref:Probable membrane transporter protein n=2 Tax=Afipia carboxidovorans TaxID=40137 RepID=F8BVZ5_AFIC5|nr:putative transmembrane protein [Afipia carboxidovorans OM4]AEI06006.1 putative transmembrane protein [Afipia carboxidovorans OM5]